MDRIERRGYGEEAAGSEEGTPDGSVSAVEARVGAARRPCRQDEWDAGRTSVQQQGLRTVARCRNYVREEMVPTVMPRKAQMHFCSDAQMPRSVKTAPAVLTDRVPMVVNEYGI